MQVSPETILILHLGADGQHLGSTEAVGRRGAIVVPMRMIFADALRLGSRSLVIGHTHPGGAPVPSAADVRLTAEIVRVATALGIGVADHVIAGDGAYFSFREAGLL